MPDADDALTLYPTPRKLGRLGRAMWRHLTGEYAWRFDELVLVERACRMTDVVERRERDIAALDSFESTDVRGNPCEHPLAAGLARDVNALRLLIASLGLGSTASASPRISSPARSTAARSAANARWHGTA